MKDRIDIGHIPYGEGDKYTGVFPFNQVWNPLEQTTIAASVHYGTVVEEP